MINQSGIIAVSAMIKNIADYKTTENKANAKKKLKPKPKLCI